MLGHKYLAAVAHAIASSIFMGVDLIFSSFFFLLFRVSVSNDLKYDSERDLRDIGAGKIEVHSLNKVGIVKILSFCMHIHTSTVSIITIKSPF